MNGRACMSLSMQAGNYDIMRKRWACSNKATLRRCLVIRRRSLPVAAWISSGSATLCSLGARGSDSVSTAGGGGKVLRVKETRPGGTGISTSLQLPVPVLDKVTASTLAPYTLPDTSPGRMSSLRLAEGSPKQEEHAFQPEWCSSSPL